MDPRLVDLAAAIADGSTIDWHRLESESPPGVTADLLAGARIVERLAQVHATLPPADTFVSSLQPESFGAIGAAPADAPATWGPLTLISKIGRGTFGDVYRARDSRLNRDVALKLLRHTDHRESAVVDEGHRLARIRHPNVVTVYGAERIDGRVGLWMELVEGVNLGDELRTRGPFPPEEVRAVGLDLARALAAVHRAGLLHRDIKAQNVMRDRDGRTVLTDFGAGRELEDNRDALELAGTPLYLAPEVLDGAPATPASDVYSLGTLLYHLATASFPVRARSLRHLRDAHARRLRTPVGVARPDFPVALAHAIECAIDPDPASRTGTAEELEARLASVEVRSSEPGRGWPRRLVAAGVAAVAAGLVAGVWTLGPRTGSRGGAPIAALRIAPTFSASEHWNSSSIAFVRMDPNLQQRVNIRRPSDDARFATCTPWGHGSVAVCDLVAQTVHEIRVPGSGRERSPDALLSPDGQRVAYVWTDGTGTTVHVVATDATSDRELFRIAEGRSVTLLKWLRTSPELVVTDADRFESRVMALPLERGEPRQLHRVSGAERAQSFDLSDDGRYVVFDRRVTPDNPNRELMVADLASGAQTWLEPNPGDDYAPRWTPDGHSIVFASDRLGSRSLFVVAMKAGRPDGEPALLRDLGRSTIAPLGFARDGTLFLRLIVNWLDVFRAPLDLGAATMGAPRRIDPRSIDESVSPDWSADDRRFAYLTGAVGYLNGASRIEIRTREGTLERLIPVPGILPKSARVRWAPAANQLAISSAVLDGAGEPAQNAIDLHDLITGQRTRLTTAPDVWDVKWDPAGAGIYYGSGQHLYRADIETGQSALVYDGTRMGRLDTMLTNFDVAPDGRSIAFVGVTAPGRTVRILNLETGQVSDRYHFAGECRGVAWSRDGSRLLVSGAHEATMRPSLWVMDAAGGEPTPLHFETEYIVDFSLRHDDRELLYATGNPRPDIWTLSGIKSSNR